MTPEPLSPEQRAERLWYRIENRLFAAGYTKEEPRGTFCRLQIADITTAIEEAVAARDAVLLRAIDVVKAKLTDDELSPTMTAEKDAERYARGYNDAHETAILLLDAAAAAIRREP